MSVPTEYGIYCPHGALVMGPISDNVLMVVDPWPCPEADCTRQRFEQAMDAEAAEMAEAVADLARTVTS